MADVNSRIADLERKLKEAKAQKALIEARKRAIESKKTRAAETRKKILLGAYLLEAMNRDPGYATKMKAKMAVFLTRDADRAAFDLPPLPKPKEGGDSA